MDRILRYGNIVNDPLYNCSARTPELIEKSLAEPNPVAGIGCMTLGIVNEIFFILCVKVMLEPANFSYPAYKIMVAISICDMIGIVVNSIVFGFIAYMGTTFCEFPNVIYIAGSTGTSAWNTGSLLSSILIINRLVEIKSTENKLLINIFNGKYTPFVLILPVIAGFYNFMREPSLIFNPKISLAMWDPLIYENASSLYFSPVMLFNDTIVVSLNSVLSICLCFNISKKLQQNFGSAIDRSRQATLFFQCLAIVSLCNIAAVAYLLNSLFECPISFQKLAGVFYQLATSLPPYIYLILNRSIRHGILKMFLKYSPDLFISTSAKTTTTWSSRQLQTNQASSIQPSNNSSRIVPQAET